MASRSSSSGLLRAATLVVPFVFFLSSYAACAIQLNGAQKQGAATTPFVANQGQWDSRVAFASRTFAGPAFVTTDGELVYRFTQQRASSLNAARSVPVPMAHKSANDWVLVERFVDHSGVPIKRVPQSSGTKIGGINFFLSGAETSTGASPSLTSYDRVELGEVFSGVAVSLRATGNNVEKLFTVAPHADPAVIRVRVDGATALTINESGALIAQTGNGDVSYTTPVAFQLDANGAREYVAVNYALHKDQPGYGFTVGAHDPSRPLVIDPLLRSTYVGGSLDDAAYAVAVHPTTGEVYVAGETYTTGNSFPGTAGGAQPSNGGNQDVFIARFSADLTQRLQATYLGGLYDDSARAIAINAATGDVYVAGVSSSALFPGVGCGSPSSATGAFVSRFNANLTVLHCSIRLGSTTSARALAIRQVNGDVYVGGEASGSDLVGSAGGAQSTIASFPQSDGFVARIAPDLSGVLQATYLGAGGDDSVRALAINQSNGDVYAGGKTNSVGSTFPGVAGGAQGSYGGSSSDGFVTRFNPALTVIRQSTYLGGPDWDWVNAITVHPNTGAVYVGGFTRAPANTFPGVTGGAQSSREGFEAGFVSKLSSDLITLVQSTYFSGPGGNTVVNSLLIHPGTGEIYLSGSSSSNSIPTVGGGAQSTRAGGADAIVARLAADLTTVSRSTFLGGSGGDESATAIAYEANADSVFVAGWTNSTGSTFPGVIGSAQPVFGGWTTDAFVSRLSSDLLFADVTPDPFFFFAQGGVAPSSIRTSNPVLISGIAAAANISVSGAPGSTYCISSTSGCTCNFSSTFVSTSGTVSNGQYVCVRHTASSVANQFTETLLNVDTQSARFIVSTGSPIRVCNLDIDGDLLLSATKEWLLMLRASLGFNATAAVQGTGITEAQWNAARPLINANCGTNF